uniref:Bell all n=1 Tax=Rhipicephalus zambeziensis TaxID=60191 RepID=A0A224YS74_9ACAR
MLTTFRTPFGRYRWLRLPFGLAASSEIFQKRLQTALDGLQGVVCVADDILVYGTGQNRDVAQLDHDQKLARLLDRCTEQGICINKTKLELNKEEVIFLGHKLTDKGLVIDPDKVKAIREMSPPTDVGGVLRLCGMLNYIARFLPSISTIMEPIRRLTAKDAKWTWSTEHEEAFEKVKHLVTTPPILAFYDEKKALTIQCDASEKGLGAILLEEDSPVSYPSRALAPTEI